MCSVMVESYIAPADSKNLNYVLLMLYNINIFGEIKVQKSKINNQQSNTISVIAEISSRCI